MRIGEIEQDKCGKCPLIDWCGNPYEEPYFCKDDRFAEMEVEEYIKKATYSRCSGKEEIADEVLQQTEKEKKEMGLTSIKKTLDKRAKMEE